MHQQKIIINKLPKNKAHFAKVMEFFKEVIAICDALKINPIVEASFALFAYTQNANLAVNDVDLLVSKKRFPDLITAIKERQIEYELKEYHVLRALKDNLKIEFDAIEYWSKQW